MAARPTVAMMIHGMYFSTPPIPAPAPGLFALTFTSALLGAKIEPRPSPASRGRTSGIRAGRTNIPHSDERDMAYIKEVSAPLSTKLTSLVTPGPTLTS